MKELTFVNKEQEVVTTTEVDAVDMLVKWAESGEALSQADAKCIADAKASFETSYQLRKMVFAAMDRVKLGSKAWKRLFDIA